MLKMIKGLLCILATGVLVCLASAQQLTVTSPTAGQYLGTNNTLTFQITGVTYQTTVTATVSQVGGSGGSSISTSKFTPNTSGDISGSLPITFNGTAPSGSYQIVVTASSSGATISPVTVDVQVVVTPPVFLDFNPISGGYVTGTVHVTATINDNYLQNWTVQVDGQDIPNNTGTTDNVSVNWDTSSAKNNSNHTVTITATDLAGNTASQSINLTVDQSKPTISISYPQASIPIVAGSEVDVVVDVSDVAAGAIDQNGIDILAESTTGAYITRVSRVSAKALNSTTFRWTGRILTSIVKLPKKFNIVATAINRAGSSATPTTVTVTLR